MSYEFAKLIKQTCVHSKILLSQSSVWYWRILDQVSRPGRPCGLGSKTFYFCIWVMIILDFLGWGIIFEPSMFKVAARTIVGAFWISHSNMFSLSVCAWHHTSISCFHPLNAIYGRISYLGFQALYWWHSMITCKICSNFSESYCTFHPLSTGRHPEPKILLTKLAKSKQPLA